MQLRVAFTAADVANTRFALSPLWEVVASVRVLKAPGEHALNRPWYEAASRRLDRSGLDWRLLSDLVPVPTVSIPAFVCPPPVTPAPGIDLELSTMRATPHDLVRDDLDRMREPRTPRLAELYADPQRGLARLADVIAAFWDTALAPYWPRIANLLHGDVLYRARLLAEHGPGHLFNDLDPKISWDGDTLTVARRQVGKDARLAGRGLLLVPSVFTYPRLFSITSERWQPTLRYPPRGIATLWQPTEGVAPEALAAVVGRARASLLAGLDTPAPTKVLAVRTGLTPGGVSQHLTAMRAAGLVSAHRTGRFVLYARTDAGESLVHAAAGGQS